MLRRKNWLARSVLLVSLATIASATHGQEQKTIDTTTEAVDRTRDTVKMLDDIYKTSVVLITDKYVEDENSFAAGSAAVALFAAMKQKGWHTAELLDASGEPYNDQNVVNDDFERQALKQIKGGKTFVEAIERGKDNKPIFRAMTAIPVVHKKCVICHANYAKATDGQAIGVISYAVPIR